MASPLELSTVLLLARDDDQVHSISNGAACLHTRVFEDIGLVWCVGAPCLRACMCYGRAGACRRCLCCRRALCTAVVAGHQAGGGGGTAAAARRLLLSLPP